MIKLRCKYTCLFYAKTTYISRSVRNVSLSVRNSHLQITPPHKSTFILVTIYNLARVDFVKKLYAPIGAEIIDFKKLLYMNISSSKSLIKFLQSRRLHKFLSRKRNPNGMALCQNVYCYLKKRTDFGLSSKKRKCRFAQLEEIQYLCTLLFR